MSYIFKSHLHPEGMLLVVKSRGPVLVDREALALITGRSPNTIRLRCEVVKRRGIRPLYDMEREVARLAAIPTRNRTAPQRAG